MKNDILTASDHLVGAVINGTYQGLILTILIALGLRLIGRSNAATRHAVWFGVLLFLPLLILFHAGRGNRLTSPTSQMSPTRATTPTTLPEPAVQSPTFLFCFRNETWDADFESDLLSLSQPTLPPIEGSNFLEDRSDVAAEVTVPELPFSEARLSASVVASEEPPLEYANKAEVLPVAAPDNTWTLRKSIPPWLTQRLVTPTAWNLPIQGKFLSTVSLALLAVSFMIALLRLCLFIKQLSSIRHLKRCSFTVPSELTRLFQQLRNELSPSRSVELKLSSNRRSPMVLGFIHPVILLPAGEEGAAIEPILRHELAHVRRYDDWTNLVQHLIQALLFFHPAVYWISRRISLEREIACDDFVLQHTLRPRAYALLLADLAGRMQGLLPAPMLAPGASTHKSQLQKRIDMILDTRRNTSPRLGKTRLGFMTATAALISIVTIYAAPRVVLARADDIPAPVAEPAVPAIPPVPELTQIPAPELPGQPAPLPGVGPGPKVKPGNAARLPRAAVATPAPPAVAATPGQPAAPSALAPVPFAAPAPVTTPTPFVAPTPPVAQFAPMGHGPLVAAVPPGHLAQAEGGPRGHSSMEQRLERLERMVESLMSEKGKPGHWDFQYHMKPPSPDRKDWDVKEPSRSYPKPDKQNVDKIKEQAKREAERAAADAKRSAKQAERDARGEQNRQTQGRSRDLQREMEAMQRQLEALERQREQINRQLERLKERQESLEDEQGEQNEDQPGPKENSADGLIEGCGTSKPA